MESIVLYGIGWIVTGLLLTLLLGHLNGYHDTPKWFILSSLTGIFVIATILTHWYFGDYSKKYEDR